MGVNGIESLIVASFDLSVVRLVRDAIRTADIHAGRGQPVSGLGPAPTLIERRFRLHPEPVIERRFRVHPEPKIEPRRVIHPTDRYEPQNQNVVEIPVVVPVFECYQPCKKSVIEPPWKALPWEQPPCPPPRAPIKVNVRPPDIVHKGSLIDFFI